MNKAFLMVFLSLIKTITPKPELTKRPANKAPNEMDPETNNSVINKLDEQFGMSPIIALNKGVK